MQEELRKSSDYIPQLQMTSNLQVSKGLDRKMGGEHPIHSQPDFAEHDAWSAGQSSAYSCIIPGCPYANFSKITGCEFCKWYKIGTLKNTL
jgi:hypothetical protein